MRLTVGLLTSLTLAGLSQALANEPPAQPPAQTQGSQPSAEQSNTAASATPAATPTASTTPAAASAPATTANTSQSATSSPANAAAAKTAKSSKPELTAQEKNLISAGYRLQMRGDQKYFCRSEAQMGTHFARTVCSTEEQLAVRAQASKDATVDWQNHGDQGIGGGH